KRALYDRLRSDEKLAHKKHTTTPLPISPRDMPGSWAWTSESTPEPNDPLGLLIRLIAWLLRVLLLVPPKLQKQPILPRQCFDYEEYAAKARANPYDVGPGISLDDIHHFLASIEGESFELDDDHNNRAVRRSLNCTLIVADTFGLIQGLFFRAQNFFLCVAMDELRRGSSHIPLFGCAHSIWSYNDWNWDHEATHLPSGLHEVEGFYAYWARFETRKCFEWVKNDSNRLVQSFFSGDEMVVQHFLQIDPRYHIHMLQAQRYAQHRPAEGDPVPAHLNRKERHKRKGRA
ncbi:hypothetical protein DXG01_010856, partial [Tephrocybe rancida]